jgi:sortase (surface protein transpeptidase)
MITDPILYPTVSMTVGGISFTRPAILEKEEREVKKSKIQRPKSKVLSSKSKAQKSKSKI